MFKTLKKSLVKLVILASNKTPAQKYPLNSYQGSNQGANDYYASTSVSQSLHSIGHLALLRLKFVIALTLSFVLVACAAGGGGSGAADDAVSVTAFSHNGYSFAADINGSMPVADLTLTEEDTLMIGRVFPNPVRIRQLVATAVGKEPQDVENTDYTTSFRIASDDVNSPARVFFSVDENDGIISVNDNPFEGALTFDEIRGLLSSNSIRVAIDISPNLASGPQATTFDTITQSVNVRLLSQDQRLDANTAFLSYNRDRLSTGARSVAAVTPPTEDVSFTGGKLTGSIAMGDELAADDNNNTIYQLTRDWNTRSGSKFTGGVTSADTSSDLGSFVGGNGNRFDPADIHDGTSLVTAVNYNFRFISADDSEHFVHSGTFSSGTALTTLDSNRSVTGSIAQILSTAYTNADDAITSVSPLSFRANNRNQLNFTLEWELTYDYTRTFQPKDIPQDPIDGSTIFRSVGNVDENNLIEDSLSFANPNNPAVTSNPISSFAISRIQGGSSPTLFYAVRDSTNLGQHCGGGDVANVANIADIYLDNNDMRLKAGDIFNYETGTTYTCRLVVSTDGISYRPLGFATSSIAENTPQGIPTSGIDVYPVAEQGSDANTCNNTPCFFGDITINVNNINELPAITLTSPATEFAAVTEGVGPMPAYATVTGTALNSGSLASGNLVNAATISITDPDTAQTGVNASDVTISRISPNHNLDEAFSISSDNRQTYRLVVNASMLDYESFLPDQLTDGKAIYAITIAAKDSENNNLVARETFNLEVQDVQYNPVFVTPTGALAAIGSTPTANRNGINAFIKQGNIINGTTGSPLYLLADIRAFYRDIIGSFAAVDPETGNDSNLQYSIVRSAAPSVIERNIKLDDSTRGSRLTVAGPGLRDGNSGEITLRAAHSDPDRHPGSVTTQVTLTVESARYATALARELTDALEEPPIRFNSDVDLVGDFTEGLSNAPKLVNFNNEVNISGISGSFTALTSSSNLLTNSDSLSPRFGLMKTSDLNRIPATLRSRLAAASGVNLVAPTNIFSINNSTGVISIAPGTEINFPAVYEFAIFVTPMVEGEDDKAPTFMYNQSDISIIKVFATDTNTPADVTKLDGSSFSFTNPFTATIKENINVGTAIASFRVTDDNLLLPGGIPTFSFSDAAGESANDLFEMKTSIRGNILTATIVPKVKLDYETPAHVDTLAALQVAIDDAGSFTSIDPDTGEVTAGKENTEAVFRTGTDIYFSLIIARISLEDIPNEPIILEEVAGSDYSISETAAPQSYVLSNAAKAVVARVANPTDFPNDAGTGFNSSRIDLSVEGSFKGILEATFDEGDDATDGDINLRVIDAAAAERLENLGDGLSLRVTIRATANQVPARSISTNVKIIDEPETSQIDRANLISLLDSLSINEQDVAGRSGAYDIPNFRIRPSDIVKDAGETILFTNKQRVPRVDLSLGDVAFTNGLNPRLDKPNILSLPKSSNGVFTLRIGDTDFIENALFGDIEFAVTPSIDSATDAGALSSTINIASAADKQIAYEDAAGEAASPPVYALRYRQSDYVEPETDQDILEQAEERNNLRVIDADTAFIEPGRAITGVRQGYINIPRTQSTTATYETVALRGVGGANRFIARDPNNERTNSFSTFTASINHQFADADRSIIINLDSDLNLTTRDLDILTENAAGNLVSARSEFDRYFNLIVNTTADQRYLKITQKVFEYTLDDNNTRTTADDTLASYNALDTIQLYPRATEDYTFNYFIRSKTDDASRQRNASHYALAQFSVEVSAAGSNAATEITNVALVPYNQAADHPRAIRWSAADGGEIELNIPTINSLPSDDDNTRAPTNSFAGAQLIVTFNNRDAFENSEGASSITIDVDAGTGPTSDNPLNLATDGNLIDIQTAGSSGDPLPLSRVVTDTSEAGATTYERTYDIALAENLYGEATLQFTITEVDQNGDPIGSVTHPISIKVGAPLVNDVPTPGAENNPDNYDLIARARRGDDSSALDALVEDTGLLSSSDSIIIDLSIGGLNADNSILGDFTNQAATTNNAVARLIGAGDVSIPGVPQNPLGKNFIRRQGNSNNIIYSPNGWGTQALRVNYVITEPRGFATAPSRSYSRTLTTNQNIIVAQVDDDTLLTADTIPDISIDSFDGIGSDGTLVDANGKATFSATEGYSITVQDNDLLFDRVENVLGSDVTITSSTLGDETDDASSIALNIVPTTTNTITNDDGDEGANNQALINIASYGVELTAAQLASLRARTDNPVRFKYMVSFTDTDDIPEITSRPTIEIITGQFYNARIGSVNQRTGDRILEGAGINTFVRGWDIIDADIARNKARNDSPTSIYTDPTFTLARRDIDEGSPDYFINGRPISQNVPEDFLKVNFVYFTDADDMLRATIRTTRDPKDADVGIYDITFTLTDPTPGNPTAENPTPGTITETFYLEVRRREDASSDLNVEFTPPTSTNNLRLNINSGSDDYAFPLSLSFTDDDFLEPAAENNFFDANFTSAVYTFSGPEDEEVDCTINSGGEAALLDDVSMRSLSGDPAKRITVTGALNSDISNLAAIKTACGDGLLIGYKLSEVVFNRIDVGTNAIFVLGKDHIGSGINTEFDNGFRITDANLPEYVIVGNREIAPTFTWLDDTGAAISGNQISVDLTQDDNTKDVVLRITDTDPDDGTPLNPTAGDNRAGGTPWGATSSFLPSSTTAMCTEGSVTISVADAYQAVAGNEAMADVTFSVSVDSTAVGTCSFSIATPGEDGQGAEVFNIAVDVVIPPSTSGVGFSVLENGDGLVIAPHPTDEDTFIINNINSSNFFYDGTAIPYTGDTYNGTSFNFSAAITDGDPDNDEPIALAISSLNTTVCTVGDLSVTTIPAGAADDANLRSAETSAEVTALTFGECVIQLTATEGDEVTPITRSIILPALPPRLLDDSVSGPDVVLTRSVYNGEQTYFTTLAYAYANGPTDNQLRGTISATPADVCSLSDNSMITDNLMIRSSIIFDSRNSDRGFTFFVNLVPKVPGECHLDITLIDNFGEELVTRRTFVFPELASRLERIDPLGNSITDTTIWGNDYRNNPMTATSVVNITDLDNDGARPDIEITYGNTLETCEAEVITNPIPISGPITIEVTGKKAGQCIAFLRSSEDDVDFSTQIAFLRIPHLAPTLSLDGAVDAITTTDFGANLNMQVTRTVILGNPDNDNRTPDISFTGSGITDGVCSASVTTNPIPAVGNIDIEITAIKEGTCDLNVTAEDNGESSSIQIVNAELVDLFVDIAPTLTLDGAVAAITTADFGDDLRTKVTRTVTIGDPDNDDRIPEIGFVGSGLTAGVCSARVTTESVPATGDIMIEITASEEGTCDLNVTAMEDGETSSIQIVNVELVNLLPSLSTPTPIIDAADDGAPSTYSFSVDGPTTGTANIILTSSVIEGECSSVTFSSDAAIGENNAASITLPPAGADGVSISFTPSAGEAAVCRLHIQAQRDGAEGFETLSFDTVVYVDADNDGLVDIRTPAELSNLRNYLVAGELNAATTGCPMNSDNKPECIGYELLKDLDLVDISSWDPIGVNSTDDHYLDGVFEGNGNVIYNLNINMPFAAASINESVAGLFGAFLGNIRNLHLSNVRISAPNLISVGGLVGVLRGGSIINSSVSGDTITGGNNAGGLIGRTSDAATTIGNSTVMFSSIKSNGYSGAGDGSNAGGLVGQAFSAISVYNSVVVADTITGNDAAAGLVGLLDDIGDNFESSMALVTNITSISSGELGNAAGLLGEQKHEGDVFIRSSIAIAHAISASRYAGGLNGGVRPGSQEDLQIFHSLALTNMLNISGTAADGGLGGLTGVFLSNPQSMYVVDSSSYWQDSVTFSRTGRSGGHEMPGQGDGSAQPMANLTNPGNAIFAEWTGAGAGWCNPTTGEYTQEDDQPTGYEAVWQLDAGKYPALRCLPITPAQQREAIGLVQSGQSPLPVFRP